MELYPLFVNLLALAGIVAGVALGIWWTIAVHHTRSRDVEKQLPKMTVPGNIKEIQTGLPVALIIFYVLMGMTLISYVLAVWLGGVTY